MKILVLLAAFCLGFNGLLAADKPHGYELDQIGLYQPEAVLRSRIPDPKAVSEYAKALSQVCEDYFAKTETPETLQIVVALKPGKQSRFWVHFLSSACG
jgi:hypothetical protein